MMKMYCEKVLIALLVVLAENVFVSGQGLLHKLMQDTYGPEVNAHPSKQPAEHATVPPHPPDTAATNNYPIQIDPKILESVFGNSIPRRIEEAPQKEVDTRPHDGAKSIPLKHLEDRHRGVVCQDCQPDLQKTNETVLDLDDRLFSMRTIVSKFNADRQEGTQQQSKHETVAENLTDTIGPHDIPDHETKSVDDNHLTESKSYVGIIKLEPKPLDITHIPDDKNHGGDDSKANISGLSPAIKELSGFLEATGTVNKGQGKTGVRIEESTKEFKGNHNDSTRNVASFSFFIAVIILFVM